MTFRAVRVSIVTEKLNEREIERIVEEAGATGYSVFEGSGKGSHGMKIEVIVPDHDTAEAIAEKVADTYFTDYAGIVYIDDVEILRREKF